MAEKRKTKKKKDDVSMNPKEKPKKEEYEVARWMRRNVPTKKTKFLSHVVEYFTAFKAVDALMESPWASKTEGEVVFTTRESIEAYLDLMLRHKFFHRAKKIPVSEKELAKKTKKKEEKKKKDNDEKKKKADDENSHPETEKTREKESQEKKEEDKKKKEKRKIRLDMHLEQVFVDGSDAYVWIYDPVPLYYWFLGGLLVAGAIAVCLFPLWPPTVRKGVYYLSVAAAVFLIFIVGLAVLRMVVFCLIWGLTFGRHHLWLFPNLTEDVGFLESFWPLWKYEYKGDDSIEENKKKKKKKDKDICNETDKDSHEQVQQEYEAEKTEAAKDRGPDRITADEDHAPDPSMESEHSEGEREEEKEGSRSESESSESQESQKSQTGKDFELVEKEEVES